MDQRSDLVERIDGRTARRDRNRVAVLDAVLELFSEGNLTPGVHEVADRSAVSLRSVYRYFEDADELLSSAIERQFELAAPLFHISRIGQGALTERIDRFVERRVGMFVAVRPVFLAAVARAAQDSRVHRGMVEARTRLLDQTRAMFSPETDGDAIGEDRFVSLDVLTQFDSLEYLMGIRALGEDAVVAYLRRELRALLGAGC